MPKIITALMAMLCTILTCGQPAFCSNPEIYVDIYVPDRAYNGTTLLPDHYDPQNTRVIELDMRGEIVWEYVLPADLRRYTNPGFDAELLPNDDVLILLPKKGIYEINRKGEVIWSHWDEKVSHDADRLPNGNTIYVFGDSDRIGDAQVKEVDPEGRLVWSWRADSYFNTPEYKDIYDKGWTHTNAVTRLANGNTLISPKNFNCLVEVDPHGKVVDIIGKDCLKFQHDPEVLPNGNILVANLGKPQEVLEIERASGNIIWRFEMPNRTSWPIRDANRLPNGNTLITGSTVILEVTPDHEVVWRVRMNDSFTDLNEARAKGFYKAQRIAAK